MHFNARSMREKIERLIEKDQSTGCWNWTGNINNYGYALISFNKPDGTRTTSTASRASYVEYVGQIPPGHYVCHRCDNPRCVNPEHLFTGTQRENLDDMIAKGRANRWGWNHGREPSPHKADVETATRAANDNRQPAEVMADYGISRTTLHRWRNEYRDASSGKPQRSTMGRRSKFTIEQLTTYANDNRSIAEIAAEAGVALVTVSTWRAKYRAKPA